MENEKNKHHHRRRSMRPLPPYTAEELDALKAKRWVIKLEVMRIFGLKDSGFHAKVKSMSLEPSYFGNTKMYDLHEIYEKLEAGKGKGKPG
jgi:hypothetical protein